MKKEVLALSKKDSGKRILLTAVFMVGATLLSKVLGLARDSLLTAFFGGALAMYVTMQIIRHKTQHGNFMIPLPLFIVLHVIFAWAVFLWQ